MRIFKNVCLNPAFPWNFYLIQSLPLGGLSLFRYAGIILAFPFGESGKPLRADRGQSEILPLIPPSPRAGFACFITDCLLSFTFSVFAFDIGFPLGGLRNKAVKKSFLFCLKNRPAKFFQTKGQFANEQRLKRERHAKVVRPFIKRFPRYLW